MTIKKSKTTQQLSNIYPPWARVRTDEQSVGYQLLNTIGVQMEKMDKYLTKMQANNYLLTVNLDEIDLTYKSTLPTNFTFDEDTTDPVVSVLLPPTVSGLLDETWREVTIAPDNDIQSFWYDSFPGRISLAETVSGADTHDLLSFTASGISVSGEWQHHLGGGKIWIETVGGTQYVSIEDNKLHRGRVTIYGRSREDIEDSESFIFPWDMIQSSDKEWKYLTKVTTHNMEDDVEIYLTSANFNSEDYLDPWNFSHSKNRNKIDEFYGLGTTSGSCSTLDHVTYISDEWQQLIRGFISKDDIERWQLLNSAWQPVSGVDLALQPFTDRAWVVTQSGLLHCYLTDSFMASGINHLKERTPETHVQIEVEPRWVLQETYIEFTPWHARPVKEILKYQVWFQTPNGTKYGIQAGSPVAWGTDVWVTERQLRRTITDTIFIPAEEYGEYLLALDVEYDDGEEHSERVLVSVNYKRPEATFDLTSLITEDIEGIDFDSNQRLWVKTANQYYRLSFNTDIMLIDYLNKAIYFKENYDQVVIE